MKKYEKEELNNNIEEIMDTILFNNQPFYLTNNKGNELFCTCYGEQKVYIYKMHNNIISDNCSAVFTKNDFVNCKKYIEKIEVIEEDIME